MAKGNVGKFRLKLGIRWKIILPFVLLAALLGLGASILLSRQLGQAEQVRYLRQLRDSGQQAADEVVRTEARLLEVERLLANTQGVPEAVALGDAEQLRSLLLQTVVNSDTDVAVVLDRGGTSLLAIRRSQPDDAADYLTLRGEAYYRDWPFVRKVLGLHDAAATGSDPEKQAGLGQVQLADRMGWAFFVAGPLVDEQGTIFGAVLAGRYLDRLVKELGQLAGAHIAIYTEPSGALLATDFSSLLETEAQDLSLGGELAAAVAGGESSGEPYRTVAIAGQAYGEVLTPFVARSGEIELGVLGASLLGGEAADQAYDQYRAQTRSVVLYAGLGVLLVLIVGLVVSGMITRPIKELTEAGRAAASGELEGPIPGAGQDEIGELANTFNTMLDGLRYTDLIRQTAAGEARSELWQSLAEGAQAFEPRAARAAVLAISLEGLAGDRRAAHPEQTLTDLNRTFPAMLTIINQHGGFLDSFSGLGLSAFFGLLPRALPPAVSALQAVHAGLALLEYVHELNEQRTAGGARPIDLAIGISCGTVIAGGIEALGKLHLTVVGEVAEQAAAIARAAESNPGSRLLVSQSTIEKLGSARDYFTFGRKGELQVPAASAALIVIEVLSRASPLLDPPEGLEPDAGE